MSKNISKRKQIIKKKLNKKRKTLKNKRKLTLQNNVGDKVLCCVCEKIVDKNKSFVPINCLRQNWEASHRICNNCWWDEKKGFAREGTNHKCPGCKKGLPLTAYKKNKPEIIDLTL